MRKTNNFTILQDGEVVFGIKQIRGHEVEMDLSGPTPLEMHIDSQEELTCKRGRGDLFIFEVGGEKQKKIVDLIPGKKVTIKPWTIHGVKPKKVKEWFSQSHPL